MPEGPKRDSIFLLFHPILIDLKNNNNKKTLIELKKFFFTNSSCEIEQN